MQIEIGKTYLTREGERITIEHITPFPQGTWVVQGIDERGRITWRSRKGRFTNYPHPLDLVREAPPLA